MNHPWFQMLLGLACGVSLILPQVGYAYDVTVDGNVTEWNRSVVTHPNGGKISRNNTGGGDLGWRDAASDARTDFEPVETAADLIEFRATASPTGLHFLFVTAGALDQGAQRAQMIVAIDTDRQNGSGALAIPFIDTSVSNDAAYEFYYWSTLSGAPAGHVTDGATTTDVPAAIGQNATEHFLETTIPWSALGTDNLNRSQFFRLTVMVVKTDSNDSRLDIGGGGLSDVIDCVTDYGDPSQAPSPNTFSEVNDQVVDYWMELYVPRSESGNVVSPLQVERFLSRPGVAGTEFVRVKNVTGQPLPLGDFSLGDEETVDAGEGMASFPIGTLGAGATYNVAVNGANFMTMFGVLPGAEFSDASAAPEMTPNVLFAGGSFALSNGGDEVILIDRSNILIDIANYGSSNVPGMTAFSPAPLVNEIIVRTSTIDTDIMNDDFTAKDYCAGVGACGSCFSCDLGQNTCEPVTCPDTGVTCQIDVCNPATGSCELADDTNGTVCDDTLGCTENDACQNGVCLGTQIDCSNLGDACNDGVCNEATDACEVQTKVDGTLCDDNDPCTLQDMCSGGVCVSQPKDCSAFSDQCNDGLCEAATGICMSSPVADNTPCDDNDLCTENDLCQSGTCQATAVDCSPLDDQCNVGTCDPLDGSCNAVPQISACDDQNLCTENDMCSNGTCTGTPVVVAFECDDDCNIGICEPGTGLCQKSPKPDGTECDDEKICTDDDQCVSGLCVGANAPDGTACNDRDRCTVGDQCINAECQPGEPRDCTEFDAPCTVGVCGVGGCSAEQLEDGTECDDGDACTTSDQCVSGTCVGSGECVPDVGFNDAGSDAGNGVTDTDHGLKPGKGVPADSGCCASTPTRHTLPLWILCIGILLCVRRRKR